MNEEGTRTESLGIEDNLVYLVVKFSVRCRLRKREFKEGNLRSLNLKGKKFKFKRKFKKCPLRYKSDSL